MIEVSHPQRLGFSLLVRARANIGYNHPFAALGSLSGEYHQ